MMKKFLLSGLVLSLACVGKAQFVTGKKMLGGQFSISVNKNDFPSNSLNVQSNTSFSTSLSLSRFTSPVLLNGVGCYYFLNSSSQRNNGFPVTEQKEYSHSFGVFINSTRLQPLGKKLFLGLTGTLGTGFSFGKTYQSVNTDYSRSNGYDVYITGSLGILYQLNERFLLSATLSNLLNLSYHYGKNTFYSGSQVNKGTNSSINLSSGLSGFSLSNVSFGVRYLLK